jgi:excisionase family DNA binding protein
MDKLYSIKDAAQLLGGLSPGTIKVWLSQGKLQRTKVGRRTMIAESELMRIRQVGGISPAQTPRKRPLVDTAETAAV